MHDYAIGDRVYVGMTGIYRKLDYKKQGPYRMAEVFKIVHFNSNWGKKMIK